MENNRLAKQIDFIVEIDKLKHIFRKTKLMNRSRYENDAEHSWHLTVMAVLLAEHANEPGLDLLRVIKMLLIHDIVEIDAGDTFIYDDKGREDKFEREDAAAKRIFGILPEDQARELYDFWREFEERETPESQFAAALDRLQPLLHNYNTEGESWKKYGITSDRVLSINKHIEQGSKELWKLAESIIHNAVEKGYLAK